MSEENTQEPSAEGQTAGQGAATPPATETVTQAQPGTAPSMSGASTTGAPNNGSSQPPAGAEQEFEVVVNGQKVKVKQSELLAGYSRDQDYRQKTQQLAAEKKRLIADYNAAMAKLKQPKAPGQAETKDEALERVRALEQKIEDNRLETSMRDLKGRYPKLNEKLFLLEVAERGTVDWNELEDIAKELVSGAESERESLIEELLKEGKHPKLTAFRQSAIDAYLAEKAKESKPKGEIGGAGSPGGSATGAKKPETLADSDAIAMRMLESMP